MTDSLFYQHRSNLKSVRKEHAVRSGYNISSSLSDGINSPIYSLENYLPKEKHLELLSRLKTTKNLKKRNEGPSVTTTWLQTGPINRTAYMQN